MKNKTLTLSLILAGSLLIMPVASAQTASSSNILQDVQSAVQSLISAKDTGNANDVALRITAFEQVLALSKSETQNYELKLVNTAADKQYDAWKSGVLDSLAQALAYYDSENALVNGTSTITTSDIKQIASDFETWRETTYLPLVEQAQDFLLIAQEADAIKVAGTRRAKITSDLANLGLPVISNSRDISGDLADAVKSIAAAGTLNKQAVALFLSLYVNATSTATSTSASATSTASSTVSLEVAPLDLTATSSAGSATSTAAASTNATSTATSTAPSTSPAISIKGLIKASLDKIRNAYQDFIDISNLVRGLLNQ